MALAENLPYEALKEILGCNLKSGHMRAVDAFIRYDGMNNVYRVHPLFRSFLKNRADLLSEDEKNAVFLHAADWCAENGMRTDAAAYYARACDFANTLSIVLSYPNILSRELNSFFLGLIDAAPADYSGEGEGCLAVLRYSIAPRLLMLLGRTAEAENRLTRAVRLLKNSGSRAADGILVACYNVFGFLRLVTCARTHKYDSAQYFKAAYKYARESARYPLESGRTTYASIQSYACMVGEGCEPGEIKRFLEDVREAAAYLQLTMNGYYGGMPCLAECEAAFFAGRNEEAELFARRALEEAREKDQFEIEAMALFYLLRLSVKEGIYQVTRALLEQMAALSERDGFLNRRLFYDLATGWFYVKIGLPDCVPAWLRSAYECFGAGSHLQTREGIIRGWCFLYGRRYLLALGSVQIPAAEEPPERFFYGEIEKNILCAVISQQSGNKTDAVRFLQKAYDAAAPESVETPFVEMGKYMRPLASLAAKSGAPIPEAWLSEICSKASIYAKKLAAVASGYKTEHLMRDGISLSERESQVLTDLYHGLSRAEIAAHRYISVNTVKSVTRMLYVKLGADNNVDAVRIALGLKLIDAN
jgi:LuxR family maltose regulon positive regulatory protein